MTESREIRVNQKNNQRFQETDKHIVDAVFQKLLEKPLQKITVREICEAVGINRSSFYLHYPDVYAVMEHESERHKKELQERFVEGAKKIDRFDPIAFLQITLLYIRDEQLFYALFFRDMNMKELENGLSLVFSDLVGPVMRRIGVDNMTAAYHMSFFSYGVLAVIRTWVELGCRETPEEIADIVRKSTPAVTEEVQRMIETNQKA